MKITFDLLGVMEKYGLKQIDLAKATELRPATISNFCSGSAQPSLKSLITMAENLNIPISEFFKVEGENQTPPTEALKCPYCHHLLEVDVVIK